MGDGLILRADGETVDLGLQEASQADTSILAKRVILVDSSGNVIKSVRTRENLAGSAGTGSSGDTNRVFTLTTSSAVDIVEVFFDGTLLVESVGYSIDNTNKQVTLLIPVWDSNILSIFYLI